MESKRIVLATLGSFGDVHPYIALALELQRRGHRPVIATSETYREKLDAARVELHPVRPNDLPSHEEPDRLSEFIEKLIDQRRGLEEIINKLILPHLRASYEDLYESTRGADLIVTHPLTLTGRLVAGKRGLRWASSVLAPASLFSKYDPLVPPQFPAAHRLFKLHPIFFQAAIALGRVGLWRVKRAVNEIRREVGLRPTRQNPLLEGQHSPALVLALFSKVLAEPQPDYPPNTFITGFPFYDRRDFFGETETPRALLDFLDAGEPPVVFTLGSSAIYAAGDFYRDSVEAARALGVRALLLTGEAFNRPEELPEGGAAFDYAPYGELLSRARAVIHQGGIGTTAQGLRAGVPALVVPFSQDQFDNGSRVARVGAGRMLPRAKYNASSAAKELGALLSEAGYTTRAAEVGRQIMGENGAAAAADAIEEVLRG